MSRIPYVKTVPSQYPNGRPETKIALTRFTADLAAELGAQYSVEEYQCKIRVGADELHVTADNYKKRVNVSIVAPDVPYNERPVWGDKRHVTQSATVNPDGRTIKCIAADIKRRVIEPSQPALKIQRDYYAERNVARANLANHIAALKVALPELDIRENGLTAHLHGGGSLPYVSANLNADGSIGIERLASMSRETFVKVLELIVGEKTDA